MSPALKSLQLQLPLAIVGMGLSGCACLRLLLAAGIARTDIFTFDQKPSADFQSPEDLMQKAKPKTLCVSPGIPLSTAWIQNALKAGVQLTSELEIATAFLSQEKIVAITGSVGKSTTAAILGAGAPNGFLGGNFGVPLATYCADLLEKKRTPADVIILELSSYQLENYKNYRAEVAVLTSLNPNHLERYASKDEYYQTKLKIFSGSPRLSLANKSGGDISFVKDKNVSFVDRTSLQQSMKPALIGTHNLDNFSLAIKVAEHLHWPLQSIKKMLSFQGLAHRMENCGERNGVLFVNDSKATTMDSVLQAFKSLREDFSGRRIHVLLGGRDKNLPWHELHEMSEDKNSVFWFFGEFGPSAKKQSALSGEVFANLGLCLKNLKSSLQKNDILLLSPGGTSLDEFKNFEERGNYFKSWILAEF